MSKNSKYYSVLDRSKIAVFVGLLVFSVLFAADPAITPSLEREVAQLKAAASERSIGQSDIPREEGTFAENQGTDYGDAFFLTSPAVLSGFGIDDNRHNGRSVIYRLSHDFGSELPSELTTAGVISPEKAHEFTLVGARPSGTS
jgi:hypothetical protein